MPWSAAWSSAGRRSAGRARPQDRHRPRRRTLRTARSRALVADRTVPVRFDPADAALQIGTEPIRRLPPGIRIAAAAPPAILFRPDGSSSGGTVDLAGRASTARVAVNWLTGRIAVATP